METSRPWNGTVTGDAGPYSDAQWQKLYQAIIGYGAGRANNGVFLMSGTAPNDGLKVQAQAGPTTSVDVLAGAALIQGIAYLSDATVAFTIAANASGNPRIDTVIVRADYALQTVRLAVLQGTAAASPVAPTLTQSAAVMWEIPIADIAVANGFTSIANTAITQRQEWVNAPPGIFLDGVLNNSAITLNTGDVVIVDTSADRAATTTTTRDNKRVLGIWQGKTAAAGTGRVLKAGIGYVRTDAAVTRGDLLTTSTTAGAATTNALPTLNGVLGRTLETTSGSGLALALIEPHVVADVDFVVIQDQKSSGTAAQTLTVTTWNTRNLNTEVVDTGNIATVGTSPAAANQFSLLRGRYTVTGFAASGANLTGHRVRLRDITNGVTLVFGNNATNNSIAPIAGEFELTGTTVIELQHYPAVGGAGGSAATTGEVEVYSELLITRHGEIP